MAAAVAAAAAAPAGNKVVDAFGTEVQQLFQLFLTQSVSALFLPICSPLASQSLDRNPSLPSRFCARRFTLEGEDDAPATKPYLDQIDGWRKLGTAYSLLIDWEHVGRYKAVLADAIQREYYRLEPFLLQAVYNIAVTRKPEWQAAGVAAQAQLERFALCFCNFTYQKAIREMKTALIGQLTCISGTVTRSSEVRPELMSAVFTCKLCGSPSVAVRQQFKYTEVAPPTTSPLPSLSGCVG
jgi:DNA replicative helicase MCM subunit Mcm2 (Cdc46/Mcm family)